MKRQYIIAALIAGGLFTYAASAHAIAFNFQQAIDTGYPGTITMDGNLLANPTDELGGATLTWNQGGLTLTATSSDNVYLDKGNAGIGVCGTLTTALQCNPSSDDNVTSGEWLLFSFNTDVAIDIGDSLFRAANHSTYNPIPSGIWLEVDGDSSFDLGFNTDSVFTGSTFKFWTATDLTQFYVSTLEASPVPEPTTMLLFGAGLAGLAGIRRKKATEDK